MIVILGIVLLEFRFLGRGQNQMEKLKLHAIFVGIFLVIAHVAIIFGMVNPNIFIQVPQTGVAVL